MRCGGVGVVGDGGVGGGGEGGYRTEEGNADGEK